MNLVISSAVRTPIGAFQGAFATVPAARLGAAAVAEAVRRAGVAPDGVDAVLLGNVLQAGQGQAPARQAALHAGLAQTTPAVTINKMCGSGLEAVIQAGRAILTGDADVVVAGGMESMTNAPYLTLGARAGLRLGDAKLVDSLVHDGLWDVYGDKHMGSCAELCAAKYAFSRATQDEYAERSYRRAQAAVEGGTFAAEIVPVEVTGRRGSVRVEHDEGPAQVDFEKMLRLKPAFEQSGTITAANASTLNDGAAALVITSEDVAASRGMPVLARIHGWSGAAVAPEWFTVAPVEATRKLFDKLGWTAESVDIFEVNEAFSVVPLAVMEEFGLGAESVNVLGGAVALGHPIGASGARILVTLMNALRLKGKRRGVASICIGGGEGLALGLELA